MRAMNFRGVNADLVQVQNRRFTIGFDGHIP